MSAPLLHVRGISKAFAAPVLKSIEFILRAGEVVALTGENGAGKSTLSKIIAGLTTADIGAMTLNGAAFAPRTRIEAERAGVRMVLQELGLIGTLTVAENLHLGHIPTRGGFVNIEQMNNMARERLERLGLSRLDPARLVDGLSIGQQQLLEIARAMVGSLKILILDEPTAVLTEPDTARLFGVIAALKAQGVGVLYISHRLDELRRISDRIVVLRDGHLVADRATAHFPHDVILEAMVGHESEYMLDRPPRRPGATLLKVRGISDHGKVRHVSLDARAGEILGIAGLIGSGRTELLRLIFGAARKESGDIFVGDAQEPARVAAPYLALRYGIGMVPEDRKALGLLLSKSVSMNITLANVASMSRHGFIDQVNETNIVDRWLRRLRIRARDATQAVGELSGGNQQKVLLARWIHRDCDILLLDEPTRGVDIRARAEIHGELDALTSAGKAVLMVSSDLKELMLICDRIAVMSAGRLVCTFERGEWSEQALLDAAFAAYKDASTEEIKDIA